MMRRSAKRLARIQLRLSYHCCGIEWIDEYPLVFPIPCPDCGMLIAAHEISDWKVDDKPPVKKRRGRPRRG